MGSDSAALRTGACVMVSGAGQAPSAETHSPGWISGRWHRITSWIDDLWGYDVFIAHRRADGQAYARALYDRLSRAGIACFLDTKIYVAGDSLRVATKRHASKATLLVVVGSPSILLIISHILSLLTSAG